VKAVKQACFLAILAALSFAVCGHAEEESVSAETTVSPANQTQADTVDFSKLALPVEWELPLRDMIGGDYYAWDITPDGRYISGIRNGIVPPGRTHAYLFRYDRQTGNLREFDLTKFNKWLAAQTYKSPYHIQPTSRLYNSCFDGWFTFLGPDGRQLLLGGSGGYRYVWAFDLERMRPQWYQKLGGISSCALWIPEKRWWLHGDTNGDLRVFTERGQLLYVKRLSYISSDIARGYDGNAVFVFGHESYACEFSLRDFTAIRHPYPYNTGIRGGFAIAPNGTYAITGWRRQTCPPYPYAFYRKGESGGDWRISLYPADQGSVAAFPGGFAFCGTWLEGLPVTGLSSADDIEHWIYQCRDDYYLGDYPYENPIRPTSGVIARDYDGGVLWELVDPDPDDDCFWAFEVLAGMGLELTGRTCLVWREVLEQEIPGGYETWVQDRFYEMTRDGAIDTGVEFAWLSGSQLNGRYDYYDYAYIRDGRLRLVAHPDRLVAYRMPAALFRDNSSI